jgi:hypothetical protein
MHTYIVYHQKTGKIVHIHNDTGEASRKPEDVLKYVNPSQSRTELAAIEAEEQIASGKAYRVNPKTKKVEAAKAGVHSSASARQLKEGPKPSQR